MMALSFFSMTMPNFLANFNQIMADAYSVYVHVDFVEPQPIFQVWLTSKLGDLYYKNFSGLPFLVGQQGINIFTTCES